MGGLEERTGDGAGWEGIGAFGWDQGFLLRPGGGGERGDEEKNLYQSRGCWFEETHDRHGRRVRRVCL